MVKWALLEFRIPGKNGMYRILPQNGEHNLSVMFDFSINMQYENEVKNYQIQTKNDTPPPSSLDHMLFHISYFYRYTYTNFREEPLSGCVVIR